MPSDSASVEVPDPVKAMLQGASGAAATLNGTVSQMDTLEDNIAHMHLQEDRRLVMELDHLVALSLAAESRDDDPRPQGLPSSHTSFHRGWNHSFLQHVEVLL